MTGEEEARRRRPASRPRRPSPSRDEADEPAGDEDPANEAAGVKAAEEAAKGEAPDDDPLAVARRERDEYLDLARRAQADFENYRKRAAREAAAAGERARGGLVRELLPVVDNLERALGSAGDTERAPRRGRGARALRADRRARAQRRGAVRPGRRAVRPDLPRGAVHPYARRAPSRASCSTWWRRATAPTGRCSGPPGWWCRGEAAMAGGEGPLQDAWRRPQGLRRGDQEGVPQARAPVPPGPQPRATPRPRSASRRCRRPTRSCPTPRSGAPTTRAAGVFGGAGFDPGAFRGGFGGFGDILSDLFTNARGGAGHAAPRARARPRDRRAHLLRPGHGAARRCR